MLLGTHGVFGAAIGSMRSAVDSVDVTHYGCRALLTLAANSDGSRVRRIHYTLMSYCRWCAVAPLVAVGLILCICTLGQALISDAGGIPVIVEGMRLHTGSEDVIRYGCRALANVAFKSNYTVCRNFHSFACGGVLIVVLIAFPM